MGKFFKTPLHRKKFKKNLAVFSLVVGFMLLIWVITMIKISGAS